MGPPLKAAENHNPVDVQRRHEGASMGPPLKAAENAVAATLYGSWPERLQWGRR